MKDVQYTRKYIGTKFLWDDIEWTLVQVFHNFANDCDYVHLIRPFGDLTLGTTISLVSFWERCTPLVEGQNL